MQRWRIYSCHLLWIITLQIKVKIFFPCKALSQETCFMYMVPLCCSLYTKLNNRAKCHYINSFLYLYRDNIMVNNQPSLSHLLNMHTCRSALTLTAFQGLLCSTVLDLLCIGCWIPLCWIYLCILNALCWIYLLHLIDLWWIWVMTVNYCNALCVKIGSTLSLFYTFSDIWMIYNFFLSSRRLFDAVPNCPGQ